MHWFVVADNQIGVWFHVVVLCRGLLDALHSIEVFSLCFFISAGSHCRRLKPLSTGLRTPALFG
jgi:hypothetical protein